MDIVSLLTPDLTAARSVMPSQVKQEYLERLLGDLATRITLATPTVTIFEMRNVKAYDDAFCLLLSQRIKADRVFREGVYFLRIELEQPGLSVYPTL